MTNNNIIVYVKMDIDGYITQVASSVFLVDPEGWTQIDSGEGDRYAHAQGNYFSKPLTDKNGCHNYRAAGSVVRETTADERAEELAACVLTPAAQIADLKQQLTSTDSQIIKCSECQLAGQPMPYDVAVLHTERQALRDQINVLEALQSGTMAY